MPAIPFLINLAARHAAAWPRVTRAFQALGLPVRPVPVTPAAWVAVVAQEAAADPPALLLGGGDGSFSRAVAPLRVRGIPVGFVPLGTGNGIARSFGINSPAAAAHAVAAGRLISAAAARANDTFFLNMASFGLSVAVTAGLRPGLKRLLGHGAYPTSIARALRRRQSVAFEATVDGRPLVASAVQVIIFNGRYVARPPALGYVAPAPALTLCILRPGSLPALAAAVLRFWAGRLAPRLIYCCEARELRLATAAALPVNVDGEIIESTPLTLEYVADALPVFVGPTWQGPAPEEVRRPT